jgi:hypothetical protein
MHKTQEFLDHSGRNMGPDGGSATLSRQVIKANDINDL